MWNSRICDKVGSDRGDRLLEYLLENNLFIENVGNTPIFDNGRWKNVIDLTITNQLGHNLVEHWHVNEVWHYKNSSTGITNLARPSFMDKFSEDLIRMNKSQILTGHACFNYHLSKLSRSVQPLVEEWGVYNPSAHSVRRSMTLSPICWQNVQCFGSWEVSTSTLITPLSRT